MTFQRTSFLVQRRPFSRAPRISTAARERIQKEEKDREHPLNETNDNFAQNPRPDLEPVPEEPAQEQVPWYLQAQQPLRQTESPLSALQKLPDLPEHPPSLLQPLLEHISIELGMDDLSLLDLRKLDPPPALGANLFMIVGTARSEKHLHVSADRLCRWLRSQYKLRPYADGLLGRNELKLKLRRRAKRSRLLSAVGAKATADTEIDAGIRTGWVCVNVGRVEGGELPENKEKRREDFVGFGARADGSNIVVQLMTEEKRGEIDLENLWTGIVNRASKRIETDTVEDGEGSGAQTVEESAVIPESGEGGINFPQEESSKGTAFFPSSPVSNQYGSQQLRAYHTSTPRARTSATLHSASGLGSHSGSLLVHTHSGVEAAASSTNSNNLASLLTETKSMSAKQALETLGDNLFEAPQSLNFNDLTCNTQQLEDVQSSASPFLQSFYDSMPTFPDPEHWHIHIELLAHASSLDHPEVASTVLMAQLMNMQIAGLIPEERTFKLVIRSILAPVRTALPYGADDLPTEEEMDNVFTILEDMEACGYDPISPDILELLHHACVGKPDQPQTHTLNTILPLLGAARLKHHIASHDWPSFWRTWRSYPQRFLPRTAEMYTVLFNAIGDGKFEDPREVIEVLRSYLPEMEREEPVVVLERTVAKAVMRALESVEPGLRDGGGSRVWRSWYERCLGAVDDGL